MIDVRALLVRYGGFAAVNGATFSVAEGEIFGLLGPNGAGKTSTFSVLSCLREADGGQVRIAGMDLTPNRDAVKRLVGVVPQDLALYPSLSARDNLLYFGRLYGLGGSELKARAGEALRLAGLEERARDRVSAFSGGMKRRLNLAAGLLHRPRLLLLDEPTVGVDPQSRNRIFENVRRLNREHGMTVLYTTHYMEEAQSLCDRVGIMDAGQLVAVGTPAELIAAHGRGHLELRVEEGAEDLAARLRESIASPATMEAAGDGLIRIESERPQQGLASVLRAVDELGLKVAHLELSEANLETVFLKLTGKTLRD